MAELAEKHARAEIDVGLDDVALGATVASPPLSPSLASGEPAIDRAHLARMTHGENGRAIGATVPEKITSPHAVRVDCDFSAILRPVLGQIGGPPAFFPCLIWLIVATPETDRTSLPQRAPLVSRAG